MATISWTHAGNGAWDKASNWSSDTVPGAGDIVTLPTEAFGYTVTIGSTVIAAAASVTADSGATLSVAGHLTTTTVTAESGATLTVTSNGTLTTTNLTVDSGATLTVNGALAAANGVDLAGGTLAGSGSIGSSKITGFGTVSLSTVDGTAVDTASGGTLDFTKNVDATTAGTFDITSGATLEFDNAVGTSGGVNPSVDFLASGGILDLSVEGRGGGAGAEIAQFNATVSGFGYGDELIVKGPTANGGDTVSFNGNSSGGTLTVKHGNTVEETIKLTGQDYTHQNFAISYNATTKDDTITVCFMAGTLVGTPDGQVAVETLKRGDLVMTTDGRTVPVTWLGRQTVSTRFGDPLRVLPIRFKAGALGDNMPARDLLLSPDHAILVDGVLIQAGALVNGVSILRETAVPEVFTYYHVEVDDHALILAENTPSETFIDNVDRLNFDNWAEHEALYPNGKPLEEMPYPRAKAYRQVPRFVRERVARCCGLTAKAI